jgi:hypothetical protein
MIPQSQVVTAVVCHGRRAALADLLFWDVLGLPPIRRSRHRTRRCHQGQQWELATNQHVNSGVRSRKVADPVSSCSVHVTGLFGLLNVLIRSPRVIDIGLV